MSIIEMRAVSRSYKAGDNEILALDNADLDLDEGDLIVILGPSGAEKSTLLNLLGGLDSPTKGRMLKTSSPICELTITKNKMVGPPRFELESHAPQA